MKELDHGETIILVIMAVAWISGVVLGTR